MSAGTAPHEVAGSGRFVAFAECVEAIAARNHEVAGKRIVFDVVNVVGGYVAADVVALVKEVIDFDSEGQRLAAQELL